MNFGNSNRFEARRSVSAILGHLKFCGLTWHFSEFSDSYHPNRGKRSQRNPFLTSYNHFSYFFVFRKGKSFINKQNLRIPISFFTRIFSASETYAIFSTFFNWKHFYLIGNGYRKGCRKLDGTIPSSYLSNMVWNGSSSVEKRHLSVGMHAKFSYFC